MKLIYVISRVFFWPGHFKKNSGSLCDTYLFFIFFRDSKDDSSHTFKLVMVGDSGVGKSCLLEKFIDLSSNNAFISTIGVDVRTHVIKLDGQSVKLQVIFFYPKKKLVKTHARVYFFCNQTLVSAALLCILAKLTY